jgi:predicted Zn-dependent protease
MSQIPTPDNALESLRAILAGGDGFDAYEIFIRETRVLNVLSRGGDLRNLNHEHRAEVGLRLQKDKASSVASTSGFDTPHLRKLVDRCQGLLKASRGALAKRILPISEDIVEASEPEDTFLMVPVSEKVQKVLNLAANTRKAATRPLRDLVSAYSEHETREWLWATGARRPLKHLRRWACIQARALPDPELRSFGFEDEDVKLQYFDLDWGAVARNAGQSASGLCDARVPEAGTYDLLIANRVMAKLVAAFSEAFLGDASLKGLSFLRPNDIGKRLFSSALNLVDDPTLGGRVGARPWDAEGQPTERRFFVKGGELASLAFDGSTGWKDGIESNRQAIRRSPGEHPRPGFHALSILSGALDFVDLVRSVPQGILVQSLDSFTLLHPGTGDFMASFSGHLLERGEPTRSLHRILVQSDLKTLFSKVSSVGRDEFWGAYFGSPSVVFSEVPVMGS